MAMSVVISFEDDVVKVVYASHKEDHLLVHDLVVLKKRGDLDTFLKKEKTKDFIVVNSFRDYFQDIIHIPPVKKKGLMKELIGSMVANRIPFTDFSYIYIPLKETVVENKRVMEVYVFVVKNSELRGIIDIFTRNGKIIMAIYPDTFSLNSLSGIEKNIISLHEAGKDKVISFVEGGKVKLIRRVESMGKGLSDAEIQDINMTINYCKQNFKVDPSYLLLAGDLCRGGPPQLNISIPVACLPLPAIQPAANKSLYLDFILPLSAIFARENIDILPDEYKKLNIVRTLLRRVSVIFIISIIGSLIYGGYMEYEFLSLKGELTRFRSEVPELNEVMQRYRKASERFEMYRPFMESLDRTASHPEIKGFLISLSNIDTEGIRLDSLVISVTADKLSGKLSGIIEKEDYSGIQSRYEKFVDSFSNNKSFKLMRHELALNEKIFNVELEYR